LNLIPDPAFQVNPDLDPGFDDQKMKKKIQLQKELFFYQKLQLHSIFVGYFVLRGTGSAVLLVKFFFQHLLKVLSSAIDQPKSGLL
jgi:hypothetical protein